VAYKLVLGEIKNEIENLSIENIILILISGVILLYFVLTKTNRGRRVRKKFRILAKLEPVEDEYEISIKQAKNLDGSNRQLKGEIIENEHLILNELLGQVGNEKLEGFDDEDAISVSEQDKEIQLANQNFGLMSGQIKSAEENQEYCGKCQEPIKSEWKVCPFCGEFLDTYEI